MSISPEINPNLRMRSLNVIDLFCGCGGMSLGAARAGFTVTAGVDKDVRALEAHSLNFPNSGHSGCDLSELTGAQLLKVLGLKSENVDVITGGPPCQGFSTIGKRDLQDSRNSLLGKFLGIVDEIRPRAFVLENVPGLLHEHYTDVLTAALGRVSGYEVFKPRIVTAFEVGAPTLRKRVFIVGFRSPATVREDSFWSKPSIRVKAPTVERALAGLPIKIDPNWQTANPESIVVKMTSNHFLRSASSRIPANVGAPEHVERFMAEGIVTGCVGTKHSADLESRYSALQGGQSDSRTKSVRLKADGYCPTLRAGTGPDKGSFQAVRPIHHSEPRVITPREAARLQGFPDWFQFDKTKWHSFRQIGNSVSPLVSEYVMNLVANALAGKTA